MQSSISLYSYEGKTNPLLHENSMHHFDDVTLFRFFSLTRKNPHCSIFLAEVNKRDVSYKLVAKGWEKCDPKLDNSYKVMCSTCLLAYISLTEKIGKFGVSHYHAFKTGSYETSHIFKIPQGKLIHEGGFLFP